jgi:uncharacterized phiE125 gp8 family phage protein
MLIKTSIVTVAPVLEPVELNTDVKVHLKVDSTEEDDLIELLSVAAREIIEERTGRSLITQTRAIKLDYFPCEIELTHGPVQSTGLVITYYDEAEVEQTLASSEYWFDVHGPIARIVPKNSWPSTKDMPGAITVTYVAGYGDTGISVPYVLRQAILLMIGHLYENRQQVTPVNMTELPEGVNELISTYVTVQHAGY